MFKCLEKPLKSRLFEVNKKQIWGCLLALFEDPRLGAQSWFPNLTALGNKRLSKTLDEMLHALVSFWGTGLSTKNELADWSELLQVKIVRNLSNGIDLFPSAAKDN